MSLPRAPIAWPGRGPWRGWRCCSHCGHLLHFWAFRLRCPRQDCKLGGDPPMSAAGPADARPSLRLSALPGPDAASGPSRASPGARRKGGS